MTTTDTPAAEGFATNPQGRTAGFFHFMEPEYGTKHFAFPAHPVPEQDFTADDGSKWRYGNLGSPVWDLIAYAPEPDPHAGCRPPASVIPADTRPYETQTAALDALPVHSLVSYRDHDGELHTLEKTGWLRSDNQSMWHETGHWIGCTTYNLVRNEVDYTIVRMGDGS